MNERQLTPKATAYMERMLKTGHKLTVEYDPVESMVLVEFVRSEPVFSQARVGGDTFADAINRLADPEYHSEFAETVDQALDALYARREAQTPFKLIFDSRFHFTSNQHQALCHLKLYKLEGTTQTIVVATEVADNPGMSITNTYETLANLATTVFSLEPAHVLWVEHYNADSYSGKPLEPNEADRYSLVQMSWDGQRFSTPWFAPLRESQLQGLIGSQEQPPEFSPALLTLEGMNMVAVRYGFNIVSAMSERFRSEPTIQQTGKQYVVIDADGKVLTACKDLDSASMFLTLWSLSHAPLEAPDNKEDPSIALEELYVIAARKGLRVIPSDTPGYRHHDWVVKYENRYAVINQYGTVITTAKDLPTAETIVLLQADRNTDPLEL